MLSPQSSGMASWSSRLSSSPPQALVGLSLRRKPRSPMGQGQMAIPTLSGCRDWRGPNSRPRLSSWAHTDLALLVLGLYCAPPACPAVLDPRWASSVPISWEFRPLAPWRNLAAARWACLLISPDCVFQWPIGYICGKGEQAPGIWSSLFSHSLLVTLDLAIPHSVPRAEYRGPSWRFLNQDLLSYPASHNIPKQESEPVLRSKWAIGLSGLPWGSLCQLWWGSVSTWLQLCWELLAKAGASPAWGSGCFLSGASDVWTVSEFSSYK